MQTESNPLAERFIARNLLDLAIRITLIGGLTVWCYRVAEPFIGMLLWSIILAVTLAPLHMRLTRLQGDTAHGPAPPLPDCLLHLHPPGIARDAGAPFSRRGRTSA